MYGFLVWAELPCPFTTHTENPSRFGVVDFAGEFGPLQGCGEGGTFDDTDGVCRCDVIGKSGNTARIITHSE